jgi:plastocyanin
VTPTAATPASAPAEPTAVPPPTATPRPAPQVDRVGFPEGYQDSFKLIYVYDRTVSKQIRVACANSVAASVKPGEPFPYGSVLLFESWRPKETATGDVVKDANGRLIREALTTIFVMRKEQGFGEAYKDLRNGEWEYVAYRPDKSVQTPPQLSFSCAGCHQAAGQDRDFVFRGNLMFNASHYGQTATPGDNEVVLDSIAFAPPARSVKVGTTVTWTNRDGVPHQIVASDKSFSSEAIKPGQSFSFTFNTAGAFDYLCTIHPDQMRGARITVTS